MAGPMAVPNPGPNSTFTRLTVLAPTVRVDLALPTDVALSDLMPTLLDMTGVTGARSAGNTSGWCLSPIGRPALDPTASLGSLDVLDGALLQLRPATVDPPEPVFDDIVDAIAATVADGGPAGAGVARIGGSIVTAVLLCLAGLMLLLLDNHSLAVELGAGGAVILLALGAGLARGQRGDRLLGTVVGFGAVPLGLVAGIQAGGWPAGESVLAGFRAGGTTPAQAVLIGCAATLVISAISLFTTVSAASSVLFLGSAAGAVAFGLAAAIQLLFDVPRLDLAAACLALAVLSTLAVPGLATRLAGLPLPVVPSTGVELAADPDPDFEEIMRKARTAGHYAAGLTAALGLFAVVSALVLAHDPDLWPLLLVGVSAIVLLLRTRTMTRRPHVLAMLAAGLGVGLAALLGLYRALEPGDRPWLFVGLLGATAVSAFVAGVIPRHRTSPSARQWLGRFENLATVALLPLAAGVMDLYSAFRHL